MFTPPKCTTCKTEMTLAIDCVAYITSKGKKLETNPLDGFRTIRIFCPTCGDYLSLEKVEELVPFPDGILNQDS